MENAPFVLKETFCSEDDKQRKEQFQKEFEHYLVDSLSAAILSKSCA